VCCSVLQCVAVCCSVLQCVAVCCSVLHEVCCSVLQRDAVHFAKHPPRKISLSLMCVGRTWKYFTEKFQIFKVRVLQ